MANRRGFTLIELLIVIAIIGILAVVGMGFNFNASTRKAKDTRRRSDLHQYRIALENYASATSGVYPVQATVGSVGNICGAGKPLSTNYIASCPTDPSSTAGFGYNYYSSDGSQYLLWGKLEYEGWWEICSDGRVGMVTTQPSNSCTVTN